MAHSVGASLPEFKQADVVEMEAEVLSVLGRGEKLKAVKLYRDRTQYIIMSNTASLYSCLMYGKGISDDSRFIERALSTMREFMEDDGQAFAYQRFIAPASGTVSFARALNRSVTSSMNDLVYHAQMWLTEGDLSPHDVGFKLNDILLSALATEKSHGYGKPNEAFKQLTERLGE